MGNIPSQESATPSASCRATQDRLLKNMRTELYLDDPCPFCKQDGIVCEVARHPPSLEALSISMIASKTVRLSTPGDELCVYGIVLKRKGAAHVVGTAFAVSATLALSAWHNFSDNEFAAGDVIMLCKEIRESVILRSSPTVTVLDHDAKEDWVVLQLAAQGTTFPCHATLCPEAELPSDQDNGITSRVVGVKDFPCGLMNACTHLTVGTMNAKVFNYGPAWRAKPGALRFADKFPAGVDFVVYVRGERTLGSCGAPYFAVSGKAFAFHVGSLNDADSEDAMTSTGHSHTSYSEGRVLARLPKFSARYGHLF